MENYNGAYINKITRIKNTVMQHIYNKRRTFFTRTLYKIEFDNGNILYMKMKPKKYQNCFNGVDFKLINTKYTRIKIIYEEKF